MCRLYFLLFIISETSIYFGNSYLRYGRKNKIVEDLSSDDQIMSDSTIRPLFLEEKKICWMRLESKKHFDAMDRLEDRYANVRKESQNAAKKDKIDEQMLEVMLKTRGAAEREVQKTRGDTGLIPAGINLGGYFMMRMPNSLLFFHRMKLRNNTHFRILNLHNDLMNMTLQARLLLNDLHLVGSYDRSTTDKDPSVLFYTPTYGLVEILLKNVQYAFEGRYRLLKDRLTIELIISDIIFDDALMSYLNSTHNEAFKLRRGNIDDFLARLKGDLDAWLKDYFNDYLMYFGFVDKNNKLQQYDKERAAELNNYIDHVIESVTQRLHKVKAEIVTLPKFTIYTVNNMEILLKEGILQGLDTMYRRSVATGKKEGNIRKADAIVGFSNLKVVYQYEAVLDTNTPVLRGVIILAADELTAHMAVATAKDSASVDIKFEFHEQTKPESLTIEGPANRMISNFKYILEQHIIAIMTNNLLYNIKLLGSLTRCVPLLNGHKHSSDIEVQEEDMHLEEANENGTPKDRNSNKIDLSDDIIEEHSDAINRNEEEYNEATTRLAIDT